jgi:Family of unknown function (DUF6247)
VTAQPHDPQPAGMTFPAPSANTPQAIRTALLPEEVGEFEEDYRAVMAEAAQSLDLTLVFECIAHWSMIAHLSGDPDAHRAMLDAAACLQAKTCLPAPYVMSSPTWGCRCTRSAHSRTSAGWRSCGFTGSAESSRVR